MPRNSVVKLVVSGAEYTGWQAVDIDSDIFTPADAFSFSGSVPDDDEFRQVLREGVQVDVYIDDDRQMAGVIDEVDISCDPQRSSVNVNGTDRGGYLVDCEARHVKASRYTLKTLSEALLRPEWGIKKVIVSNEDNRKLLLGKKDKKSKAGKGQAGLFGDQPRTVTKIDPGTRVATILDDRTRQLGVTWWLTADGNLFIGKPNYNQTPSYDFRCYRPGTANARTKNNCSIRVRRSLHGRYSQITMLGQGQSTTGNIFDGLTSAQRRGKKFKATATDPDLVARGIKRETYVVDNDALEQKDVQNHVDYDMAQRRLNGLRIYVTYPALRYEENDRLFAADTLAHVVCEDAGISGTFYVTQRRNVVDARLQQTQLTLVQKDVWLA